MREVNRETRTGGNSAGFSLVELLVVVGIIMLLAAVSMPAIGRYFRMYRIRSAQQQVAAAIQQARNRAIAKNTNNGVSFIVQNQTQYWVHVEDDQSAAHSRQRQALTFTAPDPAQSTLGTLPEGVRFATSAAECPSALLSAVNFPGGSYAPSGGFFRFNRLGGWCALGITGCDAVSTSPAPATLLMNSTTAGTFVCLHQPATGLSRSIAVGPGGRVRTQQ